MKRLVVLVVCALLVVGALYAQDKKPSAKNAINVNVGDTIVGLISGGFGIGGGYERALGSGVSLKANFDYIGSSLLGTTFSVFDGVLTARWYPQGEAIEKFFLEGGGGVWGVGVAGTSFVFPGIQADLGYKWNFGGFFLEPSLGYSFVIGTVSGYTIPVGGLVLGVNLGFAF